MNKSSKPESDLDEILERSDDDLQRLLQAGVLVTGGSGFVGRWIISALIHAAEKMEIAPRVVSINRTTSDWQADYVANRQLTVVCADITNRITVREQFGYVFHCATPASALLNESSPSAMQRVIEAGAENVINRFASSATRVVNISSGAVYGVQPPGVPCLDVDWLNDPRYVLPNSAYHRSKVAAEERFNAAKDNSGLDVVHARLFAFLAPFLPLDRHFAAGNFLRDVLSNRPIVITGDARTVRTYMYGTDLAVWLAAVAVRGSSGGAYNIGSPHETTIEELATKTLKISGSTAGVSQLGKPDLRQSAHRYVPCTARTERALGVRLEVPLDEAIERTLCWLRNTSI